MFETDPFRIRAHVPEFDAISEDYIRASDVARANWRSSLDVAYGSGARERLDLFFPRQGDTMRPIHIFIHGGYWRAHVKEDYAFVADVVCATGSIAAILEYGRLPQVRMVSLVEQVRRAALWLKQNATSFGGNPAAISASGHSAGAHLAFYLAGRGPTEAVLPPLTAGSLFLVSGIYDLRPITASFLQPEIHLGDDEAVQWSPLGSKLADGTDLAIAVGDRETSPFLEQSSAFAQLYPSSATTLLVPGADHMSIMRDMGDASSQIGSSFQRFLKTAASGRY